MQHGTLAVLAIGNTDDVAIAERRGDAALVALDLAFAPVNPAMMAFALRFAIGDALDRHADPRGVLFLPAAIVPRGEDYAAIVATHADAGTWAPWPREPPEEPPPPRDGPDTSLLADMAAALGPEQADALSIPLEVALINEVARPGQPALVEQAEAAIAAAMGGDFAARLTTALRLRFAAEIGDGTPPPPIRLD